jgi:Flp pilus assembly protein TadD
MILYMVPETPATHGNEAIKPPSTEPVSQAESAPAPDAAPASPPRSFFWQWGLPLVILLMAFPFFRLVYARQSAPETQAVPSALAQSPLSLMEETVHAHPTPDGRLALSRAYIDGHLPGKAVDELQLLLAESPRNAAAESNLCVAYVQLQNNEDGVKACTIAVALDPTQQLYKNNLNWALDERSKVEQAIAAQDKVAPPARDTAFYLQYAMNWFRLGNYARAIAVWRQVLLLDSRNAEAYNGIGTCLTLQRQYDAAIDSFHHAEEVDPANPLARNNIAWATRQKALSSGH